jgi:hypothetical protein
MQKTKVTFHVRFALPKEKEIKDGEVEVDVPIPHGQNPNWVIQAAVREKYGQGLKVTEYNIKVTPELVANLAFLD